MLKKILLTAGLALMLVGTGVTSVSASVNQHATKQVKTEKKLQKPGQYWKSPNGTHEEYISTGKISDFNEGPLKFTKAYYDLYRFTKVSKDDAQSMPAPDNGSLKGRAQAYYVKIGATVQNTSDKKVSLNGMFPDHYMTPTNEQVDVMGSMYSDELSADYQPNATRKNKSAMLYLISSNNSKAKLMQKGEYTFTTDSVLNSDDQEIAKPVTFKINLLSGKNVSVTSTPTLTPDSADDSTN